MEKMGFAQSVCFGITVTLVLSSIQLCHCKTPAGMRVLVTEDLLNKINQAELDELLRDLHGKRFKDTSDSSGSKSWTITNARISSVGTITSDINLGNGGQIIWNGYLSSITVKSDWSARISGWLGSASTSGTITASADRTSISIRLTLSANSGGFSIILSDCSAGVGGLDIDISGSSISYVLEAVTSYFEDDLRDQMEDAICESVSKGMADLSADMRDIKTVFPITVIGIPLTLDNSITEVEVTDDTIATYHKAAVQWNGITFETSDTTTLPSEKSVLGIAIDLTEDVMNNLFLVITEDGQLDGNITYQEVMQKELKIFQLTCSKDIYCLGNVVSQVATDYPDRIMGMQWNLKSATLNIKDYQIIGKLSGRVNFSADSINDSIPLFSAIVELVIPFQLKFAGGYLSTKAAGWGGHATIDRSNIGKVLPPSVLYFLELFLLPGIQEKILEMLNEQETAYEVKLPRNVNFKSSRLRLYKGVVRIEADLCYKTASCVSTTNGSWVGMNTVDKFTVNDYDNHDYYHYHNHHHHNNNSIIITVRGSRNHECDRCQWTDILDGFSYERTMVYCREYGVLYGLWYTIGTMVYCRAI